MALALALLRRAVLLPGSISSTSVHLRAACPYSSMARRTAERLRSTVTWGRVAKERPERVTSSDYRDISINRNTALLILQSIAPSSLPNDSQMLMIARCPP